MNAKQLENAIAQATDRGVDYAECPRCDLVAKGFEQVGEFFGTRELKGEGAPQSYCRGCRSVHAREQREKRSQIKEGLDLAKIKKAFEGRSIGSIPYVGTFTDSDSQRSALYKAEQECWENVSVKTPNKRLTLSESAQALEDLLLSDWYAERVGVEICNLDIKQDAGSWHYSPSKRTIKIKRGVKTKYWILVHEFAHHCQAVIESHKGEKGKYLAGHSDLFAAIYLELVGEVFGKTAHKALAESFDLGGVTVATID